MKLANRLDALESKVVPPIIEKWHQLISTDGQSTEEAIDAYGREKIGPNDGMIVWRTITPRYDADGNKIFFRDRPEDQPPLVGDGGKLLRLSRRAKNLSRGEPLTDNARDTTGHCGVYGASGLICNEVVTQIA